MSTFSDTLHSLDFRAHLIFAVKFSLCKIVCAYGEIFKNIYEGNDF